MGLLKSICAASCLVLASVLAGCGGGGGASQSRSPFAGRYAGAYYDTGGNRVGEADGAVSDSGAVSLSLVNDLNGIVASLGGGVTGQGRFAGTIDVAGRSFQSTGTALQTSDGGLQLSFSETDGQNAYIFTVKAAVVVQPSPFAGGVSEQWYEGGSTAPGGPASGLVDASGSVGIFFFQPGAQNPSAHLGGVLDSSGKLSGSYQDSGGTFAVGGSASQVLGGIRVDVHFTGGQRADFRVAP